MRSKHLLLMLLLALMAPWVANAQSLFSEDFEDGSMPTGWTEEQVTGTTSWSITTGDYSSSTGAGHGTYNAKITASNRTSKTKLITPEIDLSTVTSAELSFMHIERDWSGDTDELRVYYRTSSSGTWTLLDGQEYTSEVASWTTEDGIVLPNLSSTYQIAFEFKSNYGYGVGIDYVQIVPGSTCPKPTLSDVVSTNTNSATITWTPSGDNQTLFDIYWSTTNTAPTDETTPLAANQAGNSYTINGLTAGTRYYVWIRGNCGTAATPDVSGGWTASVQFDTDCLTYKSVPYNEGFDNYNAGDNSLPPCWNYINTCTHDSYSIYPQIYNMGTNACSEPNVIKFTSYYYSTYDPQDQYAILPPFEDVTGLKISFKARAWNSNCYAGITVGVMTDPDDASTFVAIKDFTTTSFSCEDFTTGLDSYTGTGHYIAFKQNKAYDESGHYNHIIVIDDIIVEQLPQCPEPTEFAVSEVTSHTATLNWIKGSVNQSAWQVYYSTSMTAPADNIPTSQVTPVTNQTITLQNLTSETEYYAWVRGNCTSSNNGYSAWVGPVFFYTPATCLIPTAPTVTEITGKTATFAWTSETGAYDVKYGLRPTNTEQKLTYNVTHTDDYGSSSYSYRTWGVKYPASQISGNVLTKVELWYNPSNNYYSEILINVYSGGNLAPGTLLSSEIANLDVTDAGLQTITLENPVNITSGENLWITISEYGTYTLGVGDCTNDDNRWILSGDKWVTWGIEGKGWIINGYMENWNLAANTWTNASCTENTYALTGLTPESEHVALVRSNCGSGNGTSAWAMVSFTTDVACLAPTGLAASEITNHTAKLSWEGTSESYNVKYRTAAYTNGVEEHFNTSSIPSTWSKATGLVDDVIAAPTTLTSGSNWNTSTYGLGTYNANLNIYGTSRKDWLVTPEFTLAPGSIMSFDLALTGYNSTSAASGTCADDRFAVLVYADDAWHILREWNNSGSTYVYNNIATEGQTISDINISAYAGKTVKFAFYGESTVGSNGDNDIHIDNVVIGTPIPAGTVQTATATTNMITLSSLLAERKYEAKVQGNCGDEGYSVWTDSITFTTDIACPAPTGLAASNATSSSFDLSWTNGGSEDWIVAYKTATDTDFTEVNVEMADVTEEEGLITYTLGSLEEKTEYTVKVRDNCEASIIGDGMSEWTTEVVYSTVADCSALNPVVSNITHHTATVNWDGESASGFTVKYRTAEKINGTVEEFGTFLPTGWSRLSGLVSDAVAGTNPTSTTSGWTSTTYAFGNSNAKLNIYGTGCKYWLVTPEVTLANGSVLNFDLALTDFGSSDPIEDNTAQSDDRFAVVIFSESAWTILREWNNSGSEYVYNNIATTGQNVNIDLSAYNNKTVKIAFYGESTVGSNGDNDMHIDNVVIGTPVAAGAWQPQDATTTTADLTGLTAGTLYDVKVVPNCDGTLESDIVQFTTVSDNAKIFITEGDWGTAANWMDDEMPTNTDNAIIRANATINNGTVATANNISFEGSPTPTLTIANGAQLKHNNTGSITATVKKNITGYTAANFETNKGYVLFAPPFDKSIYQNNSDGSGLRTGTYDLYSWARTTADEWTYYGANYSYSLYMYRGTGYLYANQDDTEVTFTGSIYGSGSKYEKSVYYTAPDPTNGKEFSDWNLIGNPFVCDAFLATTDGEPLAYYKMNATGDGFESVTSGAIAPMQGVFYQATEAGKVYFFRELPVGDATPGTLSINLAQNVSTRDAQPATDNAIIRFGEGNTLEKFSFREGSTKVYIPMDGKDYAVVNAEAQGELPLNFKAEKNGSYTLSFGNENVEFGYLHLIDNMTGEDVNLLETPSYSFEAKTTDYASRFKLVFSTGNGVNEESFAFISDGNIILNGEGMLQVVDVMGRIMMQEENATSVSTNGMTPGVYVLRLINGDSVKTQKIVIK